MKIGTPSIGFVLLLSLVVTKETMENKKLDIVGEAYNTDNRPVEAIAYGVGHNPYQVKDESLYMKPEMVLQLPEAINQPKPGPTEPVEEIPSVTDYYDGGLKLNKISVKCKIHANPTDCMHQSSCGKLPLTSGWCGSNNSCIAGNNIGPMEPCVKGGFIFSPPMPNFAPHTKVVNENVGGVKMTVINK